MTTRGDLTPAHRRVIDVLLEEEIAFPGRLSYSDLARRIVAAVREPDPPSPDIRRLFPDLEDAP